MTTPEYTKYCTELKEKELLISNLKKDKSNNKKKHTKIIEDYIFIDYNQYTTIK
tara:strand:+ start:3455 stop:3616 length:162 start_codon:yes stop_codon:yes gene_type:complete